MYIKYTSRTMDDSHAGQMPFTFSVWQSLSTRAYMYILIRGPILKENAILPVSREQIYVVWVIRPLESA